jgi:predicted secreted Zn-dependent protease
MQKILTPAIAVLLAATFRPLAAEPLVRMHTSYYYVDGRSAAVLAAQIDQSGPTATDGKRYAGRTKWDVQWKFNYEQQGVTCSMKGAAVAVGIAQAMPRWRGEAKGAAALRARWVQFFEALKRHEDGHKEHGLKAGKEIETALLAVKPAGNCEDLGKAANATAQRILEKYQKLDKDYDDKTEHGRTEGAALL